MSLNIKISVNILIYRPLSGSSNVKLPAELRSSKKGLINIKNKAQKMMTNLLMILIIMTLGFLCEKKILARLKKRTVFASICINMKTS